MVCHIKANILDLSILNLVSFGFKQFLRPLLYFASYYLTYPRYKFDGISR